MSQAITQTEENKTLSMSETLANNVIFEECLFVEFKHSINSFVLANYFNMVASVVGGDDSIKIYSREMNETIAISGECVKLIANFKNMM